MSTAMPGVPTPVSTVNEIKGSKKTRRVTPKRSARQARNDEVIAAYQAGMTRPDIGKTFGLSRTVVTNIIKASGLASRSPKEAAKRRWDAAPKKAERTPEEYRQEYKKVKRGEVSDPDIIRAWKNGLAGHREYRSACQRSYRRQRPAQYHELDARRKTSLKNMPLWANKKKIREFYQMARDLGLSVDHDVPLQHPLICGLHVENNLRLMSHANNCRKGNRFVCGPDPLIGPPRGC